MLSFAVESFVAMSFIFESESSWATTLAQKNIRNKADEAAASKETGAAGFRVQPTFGD
jgi:hypothetical protein